MSYLNEQAHSALGSCSSQLPLQLSVDLGAMQHLVNTFLSDTNQHLNVHTRLIDTVSEIGELAAEVFQAREEHGFLPEPLRRKLEDELGDVAFCVVALSLHLDMHPGETPTLEMQSNQDDISEFAPLIIGSELLTDRFLQLLRSFGLLAKAFLKTTRYGAEPFQPNERFRSQLHMVLVAISETALPLGIQTMIALESVIAKYRCRLSSGGTSGSESEIALPAGAPSANATTAHFISAARSSASPRDQLGEFETFAVHLALQAGKVVQKYFRRDSRVQTKSDGSPVTVADLESETLMRQLINEAYPGHGVVGEELGISNESARFKWVLDPIDGTKSFMHGAFDFGTLIALLDRECPILGLIYQPILGELLVGNHEGTRFNGRPVRVRSCTNLQDAVLLATDLLTVGTFQKDTGFKQLLNTVKFARTWGNCFGYSLLSCGNADIMIDPIMSIWDTMALIPIVKGAGGVITDYFGNAPNAGRSIVASGPTLHGEIIKMLNERVT